MPTQDWTLPNTGRSAAASATDALPKCLNSLRAMFEGATEPANTVPHMLWYDTANSVVKQRNVGDTAWLVVWAGERGARYMLHDRIDNITASTFSLFHLPDKCKVIGAYLTPKDLTAGSSVSDNYGFQIVNRGTDGTGTDTLLATEQTTDVEEAVAKDAIWVPADQNQSVAALEVIEVQINVNGSGPATNDWSTSRVHVQLVVELE